MARRKPPLPPIITNLPVDPVQDARDGWIEALLGARLRFHVPREDPPPTCSHWQTCRHRACRQRRRDRAYWGGMYGRWAQLYHRPRTVAIQHWTGDGCRAPHGAGM